MPAVRVLEESQRYKLDGSDDALFYSEPRFVHHLDAGFRARLTQLYRERIPPCPLFFHWFTKSIPIKFGQMLGTK